MPKDTTDPATPKQRRFEIKRGAAVVLYARSYRWACLKCGHEKFEAGCSEVVECADCLARFLVAAVHHVNCREPLRRGTPPENLFGPAPLVEEPENYALPLETLPVHLTANSYQWVCIECDPWCELPQHTPTALTYNVCCRNCHAQFDVAEVRHWRGLPLTHRELTQHALHISVFEDTEAPKDPAKAHAGRKVQPALIL